MGLGRQGGDDMRKVKTEMGKGLETFSVWPSHVLSLTLVSLHCF